MTTSFVTGGPNVAYSSADQVIVSSSGWSIVPIKRLLPTTGKHYAEFIGGSGAMMFGVARTATVVNGQFPGQGSTPAVSLGDGSRMFGSFTWVVSTDFASGSGASIGIAVDNDAGTVRWYLNGILQAGHATFTPGASDLSIVAGPFPGRGSVTVKQAADATIPSGYTYHEDVVAVISGTIRDATGALAARTVRAYLRSTGALSGEAVSDSGTGDYSITVGSTGEHYVVALPSSGETTVNAQILDRVVPL